MDIIEVLGKTRFIMNVDVNSRVHASLFNWNRDGKWDVFIYWVKDNLIEKVTSGLDSFLYPTISPRGDLIAYCKDRAGDENFQVVVRDLSSAKEEDVTRNPKYYHTNPRFSPNSDLLAFTSNRGGKPSQIHVYDGGEIREVTRWSEPIFIYDWISNSEIVYVKGFYNTEVRIVDINTLNDELLLHFNNSETLIGDVDVENRRFLFTSNTYNWLDIGEYELNTRSWRWVYRSSSEKYQPTYLGDSILFIEYLRGRNILRRLKGQSIEDIDLNVEELSVDKDMIAYIKSSSTTPSMLVVDGKIVIDTTPRELRGRLVGVHIVSYHSFDGLPIEAVVFKPTEWNRDTVIYIHGGPDAHIYDTWCSLCQLLALHGYIVIAPNYRGSTGYGRRFLHLNDKDLGGGDLRDIIEAWRLAKNMGSRKVYVLGASYGGYLTALALVKEPEIWDGGVAIVGFYNWYTEYEREADYLKSYDAIKMNPNLFYDRSPIFHIDKVKSPILLIHGANDPRCPVYEVEQLVEKLRVYGKKYKIKIYEDEGHSIRKEVNRIDMYRRIVSFLNEISSYDALKNT
ncbi:MAG: alpha/beta fold hydrolase [Acidilobaceae archaeon]